MASQFTLLLFFHFLLFLCCSCQQTDTIVANEYKTEGNPQLNDEITPVIEHQVRKTIPCLGCAEQLDVNIDGVEDLVDSAIKHIESEATNKYTLVKVLNLQRQIVAGVKYTLLAEFAETQCTKDNTENSCPPNASVPTKTCLVEILDWISRDRYVVANNCTNSQEYVSETERPVRTDWENEIESDTPGLSDEQLRELEVQILPFNDVAAQVGPSRDVKDTQQTPQTAQRQPTFATSSEENTSASSEENASDETPDSLPRSKSNSSRPERSTSPLEKVTPEERYLVRYLAEFAASTLDNMDDDNHRRVVLQVLGAKKMVFDGTLYHLTLRIGVSKCLEDEYDERCGEKLFENLTKICKVQVHVDEDNSNPRVLKSQCQTIKKDDSDINRTTHNRFRRSDKPSKREKRSRPGAAVEFTDEAKIDELLQSALSQLSATSDAANQYKVVEVLASTRQIVAGVLYKISAKICAGESCETGNEPQVCTFVIWDRVWLPNGRQTNVTCEGDQQQYSFRSKRQVHEQEHRRVRRYPGGETKVEPEMVEQLLHESLVKLDAQSENDYKYKVLDVVSATKQVVSGLLYRIQARIGLSDCSVNSATENTKECGVLEGGETKECTFTIWDQPWKDKGRQIGINCDGPQGKLSKREIETPYFTETKHKVHKLFKSFMKTYRKRYEDEDEYHRRFQIFQNNMATADYLNANEQGTAWYGASLFADISPEEFQRTRLGLRPDLADPNNIPFSLAQTPRDVELPTSFDWRTKNAVTEVKDQGSCGSCWAFSVTGNIEGQYAIKHGKLLEFSEQELVDCDKSDEGCNGGLMDNAYRAIEKLGGLETEGEYPYEGDDESCHFNKTLSEVHLTGALNISHNETDMAKWLVKNGPISIAINANAMQLYMGGVSHPFKFLCSPESLDHGVLIVGYGVHSYPYFKKSLPFWIVKNSWGSSWGEQGYYRVYRGDGTCGLNQTPSSAIVE